MIPRLRRLDSTARFLAHGYTFVGRQARATGSDAFRTRLMLRPVLCAYGEDAAGMFYGGGRFTRGGAMPMSVVHLLQDLGSVQTLDGAEHDHRKLMFLAAQRDDQIEKLLTAFREEWERAALRWEGLPEVDLYRESVTVLARTASRWAGLGADVPDWLADELSTMVDRAAAVGPLNWAARARRRRAESWSGNTIAGIRSGDLDVSDDSLASIIAHHRDLGGQELPTEVAAVELLNILRPTVAIARFIVFAAVALRNHPDWVARCADENGAEDRLAFAHEVRRFYPFFPVVGGRALTGFEWHDDRIEAGQWVMLDLYGTNHDERIWSHPGRFDPDRFRGWEGNPNTLVPQGAGDVATGHRCPGETATVAVTAEAIGLLTASISYAIPDQDLRINLRRMPALPESDLILTDVRRIG